MPLRKVPLIHMNHSNQKLQSLWWHLRPRTYHSTPLRNGDFRLKTTLSSNHFGPNEHLSGPHLPNARCLTCPPGLIDPYEAFESEIKVTLVIFEATNVLRTPLRNGDFRLKKTLSSYHFGHIEHLAWFSSPNLDVGYAPQVPLILMNHSNQKLQSLWWHWRPRT